jgi:hypothetical protein
MANVGFARPPLGRPPRYIVSMSAEVESVSVWLLYKVLPITLAVTIPMIE